MVNPIVGRIKSYLEVFILFAIAGYWLPITLVTNPLLLITSPSKFQSKWFSNLWGTIGPMQGAKSDQLDQIGSMMSRTKGLVLEIGPGTGEQTHHYQPGQITKIYGAEPNEFMHGKLLEKAKLAGLEGRYIPLLAGGEPSSLLPALQQQGLIPKGSKTLPSEGIFDYIVSVKVLCSLPQTDTAATVAVFQRLLKPNGEFLFFEHVENDQDWFTRLVVTMVGRIWTLFTAGCRLDSKLDKVVLGMGGWSTREVKTVDEFQGYEIIRFVKGFCVKAKA